MNACNMGLVTTRLFPTTHIPLELNMSHGMSYHTHPLIHYCSYRDTVSTLLFFSGDQFYLVYFVQPKSTVLWNKSHPLTQERKICAS